MSEASAGSGGRPGTGGGVPGPQSALRRRNGAARNATSGASARERWQRLAPEYLEALGKKEKGDFLRFRLLTPRLMGILGPLEGRRVLDVGCGDGYLARRMARKGASVRAFDWVEALIAYAAAREKKEGLGILYRVADASRAFSYGSETFDLVVCSMVLKDMPRIRTTVAEISRVARKGGRFVLTVLHPCFCMNASQWEARKALVREGARSLSFRVESPYPAVRGFAKTVSGSRAEILHFHRPVSYYARLLRRHGFLISGIWEPVLRAGPSVPARYNYATLLPPFLLMEGLKST
ncbi:MAG: class I SAM-dependent methyltransferase [bacterium]